MLSRRDFTLAAAISGAAGLAGCANTGVKATVETAPTDLHAIPMVEGPITGGDRGHIFGGYYGDLAERGYVEEEFFVSGTARKFASEDELPDDGRWTVSSSGSAPYKTRVIVHRPKDPTNFNGIVICEWTNVSSGMEISNAVNERFYNSGFAYAAISAQSVGIIGFPPNTGKGLTSWDPARYGTLDIPGDSYSYDIFTQVARALASASSRTGADPMDGLTVSHSIAMGESQSAARLAAYINAVHPLEKFFTGFIPVVHVGGATELEDFIFNPELSLDENNDRRRSQVKLSAIRSDQTTPVLILNSETEAAFHRGNQQADSKWIRVWELAGAVHGSAADIGYRPDVSERDGIRDFFGQADHKMVRMMPTMEAVALGMVRWVEGGAPLPRQPRLLRGDDGKSLVRDSRGNVLGGVRLPEIAAPTARFDSRKSPAAGERWAFSEEVLTALYPNDQDYLNAVRAAVERCILHDVILPYVGEEYIEQAKLGPSVQG